MKRWGILAIVLCALSISAIKADFFAPRNADKFNAVLNDYDLAVVFLNPYDSQEAIDQFDDIEEMKSAFIKLSNQDRYQRARIAFIAVNAELNQDLINKFNIEKDGAPTLVLFKNGSVFKKDGKVIKRTGLLSGQAMKDYIETYFDGLINERAPQQVRKQIRYIQPARQQRVVRYVSSPQYYYDDYDYDSYYSPYYSGGYRRGYYGSRFGGGIGFGGRRGGIGFGFGW